MGVGGRRISAERLHKKDRVGKERKAMLIREREMHNQKNQPARTVQTSVGKKNSTQTAKRTSYE